MSKIVCSVCGSEDVQAKVWTKPNENFERTCDFIDELIAEPADCWCCACEENQKLIMVDNNETEDAPDNADVLHCNECGSTNIQIQARAETKMTNYSIWMRLGVSVFGSKEDIEKLLTADTQVLDRLIKENKFTVDGETYIPAYVVSEYNNENNCDFEEKDIDLL